MSEVSSTSLRVRIFQPDKHLNQRPADLSPRIRFDAEKFQEFIALRVSVVVDNLALAGEVFAGPTDSYRGNSPRRSFHVRVLMSPSQGW